MTSQLIYHKNSFKPKIFPKNMENQEVIEKTANYMKQTLASDSSGHDWWHTYRVWKLGKKIAVAENADI
jgi:uncharacterized protein